MLGTAKTRAAGAVNTGSPCTHVRVGRVIYALLLRAARRLFRISTAGPSTAASVDQSEPLPGHLITPPPPPPPNRSWLRALPTHTRAHTHTDTRTCIHTHTRVYVYTHTHNDTRTAPVPYGTTGCRPERVIGGVDAVVGLSRSNVIFFSPFPRDQVRLPTAPISPSTLFNFACDTGAPAFLRSPRFIPPFPLPLSHPRFLGPAAAVTMTSCRTLVTTMATASRFRR